MRFLYTALLCFFLSLGHARISFIETLSVEEKVGQLLIVHCHGTSFNEEMEQFIKKLHIGGIIYYPFANPFSSKEEVISLNIALQQASPIPLFICVDQEGGMVSTLKEGFVSIPSHASIAKSYSPDEAKALAYELGYELKSSGINVNFSPVIDVVFRKDYFLSKKERSFGSDPQIVTAFGKAFLEGFKNAGILSTLKHFPGHGDATSDSHASLPQVTKTLDTLKKYELYPYIELLSQADALMAGHLLVPALDPIYPTTLSYKTLSEFLKNTLHFQGLVFSDSLIMQGLLDSCDSIEDAAVQAFNAGCDLLVLGGKQLLFAEQKELSFEDVEKIHKRLISAVNSKEISKERLDQALYKILATKHAYGLFSSKGLL